MQQYKNQILPSNHPISRYVENVAQKLVTSAELGHVKGYGTPSRASETPSFSQDSWNPDEERALATTVAKEEWTVHVINDPKTRNAFVLPG